MRHFIMGLLVVAPAAVSAQSTCLATPIIEDNTRLSQISDIWFGDSSYRFAILVATNMRTEDPKFNYIADINALPKGGAVCVPHAAEALRHKTRYDRYIAAVRDMSVAHPFEVVDTLDPLPTTGTFEVATWVRSSALATYPVGQSVTLASDVWVTLAPHLQEFCTAYAETVSGTDAALNLRVEQRLGLPPGSTNSHFVTFKVDAGAAGAEIFRPCGDPATDTRTCAAAAPQACTNGETSCAAHRDFFYQQYYTAFGTDHPIEFPWTSLGYTFDWGPAPVGFTGETAYLEVGESEYVIPSGTTVDVASVMATAAYCGK